MEYHVNGRIPSTGRSCVSIHTAGQLSPIYRDNVDNEKNNHHQ
jgi:hypothetical protein